MIVTQTAMEGKVRYGVERPGTRTEVVAQAAVDRTGYSEPSVVERKVVGERHYTARFLRVYARPRAAPLSREATDVAPRRYLAEGAQAGST